MRRFVWSGDRTANKRSSAEAALSLLIELAEAGHGPAETTGDDTRTEVP